MMERFQSQSRGNTKRQKTFGTNMSFGTNIDCIVPALIYDTIIIMVLSKKAAASIKGIQYDRY